ncbi:putative transcription factor bZIP family [Dioscorea sansibarensis]
MEMEGSQEDESSFSHEITAMLDHPPRRGVGHRRAQSEILGLPDDISFDTDLGVVGSAAEGGGPSLSDEADEDLLSGDTLESSPGMMSGIGIAGGEGLGSSWMERPRIRHQHSQSMDGSTMAKPETLGNEGMSPAEAKKAMAAAKLQDLAAIDPKRAKRIWANRQSAARSKERKMRYIAELERKVQALQTEATTMSAQLVMLQRDHNSLMVQNNELKLHVQSMEQQVLLQDGQNNLIREEIQRLKLATGQVLPNSGGQAMNYGPASFGANQQLYNHNRSMQSLLAAQQLQQLHLHSPHQQQLRPTQQQDHQPQQQSDHRAENEKGEETLHSKGMYMGQQQHSGGMNLGR